MSEKQPPPSKRQLSEEEKAKVTAWYQQHGPAVVQEVRKWLRRFTIANRVVSPTTVAGQVWESFLSKGIDDVDLTDEKGVWAVLAKAAKRHCETLNRAATRHPRVSLNVRLTSADGEVGGSAGFDPADTRELAPEVVVLINECAALFHLLTTEEKEGVGEALARVEGSMDLLSRLTDQERHVLALKMAKMTRPEIAARLDVETYDVDKSWMSVLEKAEDVGGATEG
jgi:hypothetical protein